MRRNVAVPLAVVAALLLPGGPAISSYSGPVYHDASPPRVAFSSTPGPYSASVAVFKFFGWDDRTHPADLKFECSIDASVFSTCTSQYNAVDLAEGPHVFAVRATDLDGNTGLPVSHRWIVDLIAPVITGSRSPDSNQSGWNDSAVTVSFSCSDDLSGVRYCSPPTTLHEGPAQSVVGRTQDNAGNSATASVSNINVDLTPPVVAAVLSPYPYYRGWRNGPVTVSFTCHDDLSGVDSCSKPVTLGEGAAQSVIGNGTDRAGNQGTARVDDINVDLTNPTIVAVRTPDTNRNGWNNTIVTVDFSCSDALSGVETCTGLRFLGEGADQTTTGWGFDRAGNSASWTVTGINVDLTKPTIAGARAPAPNARGWNNSPVTVTFRCADALSGVDTCSEPTTLGEGARQAVDGMAVDRADNSSQASVTGINVDLMPPSTTVDQEAGSVIVSELGARITGTASDGLSGVSSTTVSVTDFFGSSKALPTDCLGCGGRHATWSASVGGLTPGVYIVQARSLDIAGNLGDSTTPVWLVIL